MTAPAGELMMMTEGGANIPERGVALIDAVFFLGVLALFLVLLLPRQREASAPVDGATIGAEGEAVKP